MDDVARARAAAREAVSDITPPRLRTLIDDRLADATVTPGVLTLASARATGEPGGDELDRRVAGVQLIYDGLSLTRTLARAPPWEERPTVTADMEVLVADVLVGRGFYLLARTEAAGKAVETVRAFGHDETIAETAPDAAAGALETDVFELAVVAGASAAGVDPPAGTRAFAADLADTAATNGSTPSGALSESTVDALDDLLADAPEAPTDRARASSGTTDT
jgi:hypothetical protein